MGKESQPVEEVNAPEPDLDALQRELDELPAKLQRALVEGDGERVNALKQRRAELPMLVLAARVRQAQETIRQLDVKCAEARPGAGPLQLELDDSALAVQTAKEHLERASDAFHRAKANRLAHTARITKLNAERDSAFQALEALLDQLDEPNEPEPEPVQPHVRYIFG